MKWKVFCFFKFNSLVKFIGRFIYYYFVYLGIEIFVLILNLLVFILIVFYFFLEFFDFVGLFKEMN